MEEQIGIEVQDDHHEDGEEGAEHEHGHRASKWEWDWINWCGCGAVVAGFICCILAAIAYGLDWDTSAKHVLLIISILYAMTLFVGCLCSMSTC